MRAHYETKNGSIHFGQASSSHTIHESANLIRTRGFKKANENMNRWKLFLVLLIGIAALAVGYGSSIIRRGFSATDQPSAVEVAMARTVRNLGIPRAARDEKIRGP